MVQEIPLPVVAAPAPKPEVDAVAAAVVKVGNLPEQVFEPRRGVFQALLLGGRLRVPEHIFRRRRAVCVFRVLQGGARQEVDGETRRALVNDGVEPRRRVAALISVPGLYKNIRERRFVVEVLDLDSSGMVR